MPARTAAHISAFAKTSDPSTRSSKQACASRRPTEPNRRILEDDVPTSLRPHLCSIFYDAQRTTASHRKLVVGLRKIQEALIYQPSSSRKGLGIVECEEDDFNHEFARCVIRVLGVKKTEATGDKSVRFVGTFLRHASEKDVSDMSGDDSGDVSASIDTPSSRLTSHVLSTMLQFLVSKDKTARYRSTQLISHIINSLDSIDDEYYHLLKMGLLKRVRDKEPMVRVQAVLGLGRLAGNEEDTEEENENCSTDGDAHGLLDKLLDVLQHDPSADVRRALLLNLPLTPVTLPFLLERARDVDAPTRRALYSRLLPALGDFRHLSLSMREKLLRWGLRDRDDHVRKATAKLFRDRWIEDCVGSYTMGEAAKGNKEVLPNIEGLLELLERIDVVNSGGENGIATGAMKEFWEGRPDYQEAVSFADPFWHDMSPESAFLARTFNDFCRSEGGVRCTSLMEENMPEVTKLAFILQRYINLLMETLRRNDARNSNEDLEDSVEQEFTVEQLLHIAKTLDYSDEVGRRKMFALLREVLAMPELPDHCTMLVTEILRDVCGEGISGEREFCGVVLEAVAEVHDVIAVGYTAGEVDDESFHSARSELSSEGTTRQDRRSLPNDDLGGDLDDEEKAIREITINMKCLHIAQCMLQNVECALQQNIHLVAMLNNLIVPAVRSHDAPLRERGLLCLGLCCLLDRKLADENVTLFLHCFNKGHEALQITALQISADILTAHPGILASPSGEPTLQKQLLRMFSKGLKAQGTPEVQTAAAIALCKLMLTSAIADEDLLKQLVLQYFDGSSKENAGLQQALAYFLPVYCHSRRENMEMMACVAGSILHAVIEMADDLEEDDDTIAIGSIGSMLVDWTDARRLVIADEVTANWNEAGRKEVKAVNGDIHLVLADSLLEQVLGHGCTKEEKKALIPLLGKLYITSNSDIGRLHAVNELVIEALDTKIAAEATSKSALSKLHLAVSKAIAEGEKTGSAEIMEQTILPKFEAHDVAYQEDLSARTVKAGGIEKPVEIDASKETMSVSHDSTSDEVMDDEDDL